MKRPWAFICAAEGTSSAHLRRYCRTVFECGYVPVCPRLQDGQFVALDDPDERHIYNDIVRDKLLRCPVLVVCGRDSDATVNAQLGLAKNTAEFVQPWMGSLRLRPEANRLSAELSTSSQPVNGFASIAFGYPNAHLGRCPKPRCVPMEVSKGE